MMEAEVSRGSSESHGIRYVVIGKGVVATGIRKAPAGAREGQRGEALTVKNRYEEGCIGILVQRQVTPRWADDPVRRHIGGGGAGAGGGCAPRKDIGYWTMRRVCGRVKTKYVTIIDGD